MNFLKYFFIVSILIFSSVLNAMPFDFSYSGRITKDTGEPIEGPINIQVKFYRVETGGEAVAINIPEFSNVILNEGVFQLNFTGLTDAQYHQIFSASEATYIEIMDAINNVTYPRQKFSIVPFALKVPVDDMTISYNSDGKLTTGPSLQATSNNHSIIFNAPAGLVSDVTYVLPTGAGNNKFLQTNSSGELSWVDLPSGSEVSGGNGGNITDLTITNDDISAAAAIEATKLGGGGVSNTEFGYLDGVTSAIQTQINGKSPTSHDHDAAYTAIGHASNTSNPHSVTKAQVGLTNVQDTNVLNSWNQNDAQYIGTDEIRALDSSGLKLYNDAGTAGVIVDDSGNVGIGVNPTQKLSVAGMIETTSNGFKYPDGTTQTTASKMQTTVKMSYTSSSQITAAALSGTSMSLQFTDGVIRTHAGSLIFDFANGTSDLGLDTGSEASSTWYYLYAVPKSGSDFTLKGSVTPPSTGPTGFSTFRYLGAFRNDGSSNIRPFYQVGRRFYWQSNTEEYTGGAGDKTLHDITLTYIPLTAGVGLFKTFLQHNGVDGYAISQAFYIDGSSSIFFGQSVGGAVYDLGESYLEIPLPGVASKKIGHESTTQSSQNKIYLQIVYTVGWEDEYL